MHRRDEPLIPVQGSPIYFQGPSLDEKAVPSVLYFALSGRMSLFEDPFNQPVLHLAKNGIRVFSWDLPYHEPGRDPQEAMRHWANEFIQRPTFISEFLDLCEKNIDYLIDHGFIDPARIAVAGLSRGGFIATHLAARNPRINIILGFAPLTEPRPLDELKDISGGSFEKMSLSTLADQLIHSRLRFYMGNRDVRVGTDCCYRFIRHLTETAFEKGIRSPSAELIIYPSIGHKGHGTPPSIFQDGADWMMRQLTL